MAEFFSGKQIGTWSGHPMIGKLTGDVSRSGNTVTLSNLNCTWTATYGYGSDSGAFFRICDGWDGWNELVRATGLSMKNGSGSKWIGSCSVSVGTTDTSHSFTFRSSDGAGISFTVYFSSGATAPTAPTISAAAASGSQINVTWGTTNLGNPTGTVYLYNGTSSSPSTQISSKTTTGNSTYNNTGLTANTKYYYKATASNTAGSASSSVINATTYPAGITSITGGSLTSSSIVLSLVFASSGSALTTTAQVSSNNTNWNNTSLTNVQGTTKTYSVTGLNANTQYTRYFRVNTTVGNSASKSFTWTTKPANITSATATNIGETTATVAVACGTSGSAATTNLQVSSDNVNWTTVANNVQGTTVNVSLTGLTPNTSVTRYFRVHTVYGDSSVATVTFTTLPIAHFYGSVNGETKRIKKLYGSVNGQTKTIKKVYASVNGQTKLIYRG